MNKLFPSYNVERKQLKRNFDGLFYQTDSEQCSLEPYAFASNDIDQLSKIYAHIVDIYANTYLYGTNFKL